MHTCRANPELIVGLDPSLGNEREGAIAPLGDTLQTRTANGQGVSRVRAIPVDTQTSVDCILARVDDWR